MNENISVIIPVYKVEDYLDDCLRSVVAQSYPNLEIILVDDGSPDHCGAMCDAWAAKDRRIKVIHKENGGLSDARNAGLELATGKYISFVDSDDWLESEFYEKLLAALQKEGADICACSIASCFPDHTVTWGCPSYTVSDSEATLAMLYRDTSYPVSALNKLYRRELWEEMRFPVGKICEDAFTTYQLVHRANRIVQLPEALYCYRIRPDSIMTSSFTPKKLDEEEAWRYNYLFAKAHYPSVAKAAFDFYLQRVNILLHTIPAELREVYQKESTFLRSILKKHLGYILFASTLGIKQRIKLLLDYFRYGSF